MTKPLSGPSSHPLHTSQLHRQAETHPSQPSQSHAAQTHVGFSTKDTFSPASSKDAALRLGANTAPVALSYPQQQGGMTHHTVREGDTLTTIAAQYGVSVQALKDANPSLQPPYMIFPGQQLNVPVAGSTTPQPGTGGTGGPADSTPVQGGGAQPQAGGTYTVREGDTLSSIAARNGVTLQALKDANPNLKPPYMLSVGQQLNLPPNAQAPSGGGGAGGAGNTTGPGPVGGNPGGNNNTQAIYNAGLAIKQNDGDNTTRWDGKCLAFVGQCLKDAGINDPYVTGSPDPQHLIQTLQANNLLHTTGEPPIGAVVLWDKPDPGHAAIYAGKNEKGEPVYLTTKVAPNQNGIEKRTIKDIDGDGTKDTPTGWYVPGNS